MSSKATAEASSASKTKSSSSTFFAPQESAVQFKLSVGQAGDKYEQEADRTADKVMRMPEPKQEKIQRQPQEKLQKKDDDKIRKAPTVENRLQKSAIPAISLAAQKEEKIQRKPKEKTKAKPKKDNKVGDNLQSAIQAQASGGQPLSADVRSYMESRFNADFSNIRIHNNREAGGLSSQLGARAFTYQNHVFFGPNQYQPGSSEGKQLIAHELTHTIQQGHAAQKAAQPVTSPVKSKIQRFLGIDIPSWQDVVDWLADKAYNIPGYRMFTIVIGSNPINGADADRSAANILRAVVEFLPGGKVITDALEKYGVFEKAGSWVEGQLKRFGNLLSTVKNAIDQFLDDLDFLDIITSPGGTWNKAVRIFSEPVEQIISFIKTLFSELFEMIRKAVLLPLAGLAQGKPGFDLLCAVLGENPITGDKVERSAENLIGGFMKMIGREDIWENIQKGKAIPRAWAWFNTALNGLLALVRQFPTNFINMLKSLEVMDFIVLPNLFVKVFKVFGQFALDFGRWALNTVLDLLEILFSVVAPGVMPYLKKAQAAFTSILQNPVGFVGNLVRAGKQGFQMFASNIGKHLKEALIKWLVGPLAEAGVYIPKSFDLLEIIKLVLSVLGLTWQNIRAKLVKIIPEPVLVGLEKTAGILVTLVKDGPAAAWEQIKTELSELKSQLISQVTEMITSQVVQAAVTKLVTMLNPAGAVIQAIIATYNTVTFFIEKINQIAAVVASFIDSISAIAAGQVMPAAKRVETTLANTLTVAIAFLAKFVGLGGIPGKLVGIVQKIRKPIDAGLDKIVAWLGAMLKKAGNAISNWWKGLKKFTRGKENHKLFFVGEDKAAQLNVESTRMTLRNYLDNEVKPKIKSDNPKFANIAKIEASINAIEKIKSETSYGQQAGKDINTELENIANWLSELGDDIPKTANVQHITQTLPDGSTVGKSVTLVPLTRRPPDNSAGSAPYQTNPTWLAVNQRTNAYIRGHLLNHHLYGPGKNENLTPITRSMNTGIMSNQLEEPSKEAVFGKGQILRYHVSMEYGTHSETTRKIPQELYLPTSVTMKAEQVEADGTGWKTVRVIFSDSKTHSLPPDNSPIGALPKLHRLSINAPDAGSGNPSAEEALLHLNQIGEKRLATLLSQKPFKSWDEVEKTVNRTDIVNLWKTQKSEFDGTSRLVYFHGKTEWKV